MIREPVPPAEDLPLLPEERYIIVAGSVAEGECALLDTERRITENPLLLKTGRIGFLLRHNNPSCFLGVRSRLPLSCVQLSQIPIRNISNCPVRL